MDFRILTNIYYRLFIFPLKPQGELYINIFFIYLFIKNMPAHWPNG